MRWEIIRLVMKLIDFGKGESVAEFEGKTLGQIADQIIETVLELKEPVKIPTRVYCLAYEDITPRMDGPKTKHVGNWESITDAEAAMAGWNNRAGRHAPQDLHIETRYVTEWERV